METTTAMDVEEQPPSLTPNNVKRFGIKNSIQTNFGDDYVFQIVPKYVFFFHFPPKLRNYTQTRLKKKYKVYFFVRTIDMGGGGF